MQIYTYIKEESVEQGDIFTNVFSVEAGDIISNYTVEGNRIVPHFKASKKLESRYGVVPQAIVLSNSCNIVFKEGRKHTDHVLFAPILNRAGLKESVKHIKNLNLKNMIAGIRNRKDFGRHPLPPSDIPEKKFKWLFVDFQKVFVVSWDLFLLVNKKQESKIRLLPPYRESLSNRFGNYISRVAVSVE